MKLSISNIAWDSSEDKMIYELMQNNGFSGLEIAPTRVFPEHPYDRLESATEWAEGLKNQYGFSIPSMQSIWFGRQEMLFGTEEERKVLVDYTKKAIDFAAVVGCGNLVFGCPRNRNMPDGADVQIGVDFFRTIGEYALSHGVDELIAVGSATDKHFDALAEAMSQGAREYLETSGRADVPIHWVHDTAEADRLVVAAAAHHPDTVVLLKGSHVSGLSALAERWSDMAL